jgi:hypothetical protein
MKKTLLIISLVAALALAGCGEKNESSKSAKSETTQAATTDAAATKASDETPVVKDAESSKTEQDDAESSDESSEKTDGATAENPFNAGIWFSTINGTPANFYFFSTDGTSGSYVDAAQGMGLAFAYKNEGSTATFEMGSADNASTADVTVNSDGSISLNWNDRDAETLTYYNDMTSFPETFLSNDELGELALDYYEMKNDYRPSQVGVGIAEDGKATIQLYDNLGDHSTTSAWYTIDKFTLTGEDGVSFESVDFNEAR